MAAAVAGVLVAATPVAAAGSDFAERSPTWDVAAARLGTAGSLWEPARTAGLPRGRTLAVLADNLAFADGAVTAGDTYVGVRYGSGRRSFQVAEKWADTGWSAEPVVSTGRALVERVPIRLGLPGTRITVIARVYADCFPQPADANPRPIPARFRCTRGDVLRTGGTLEMTARPASTMTAPGTTSVVISSTGLSFRELVGVAASLEQVAGSPASGAGSAQMVAMCGQMTRGRMTAEQASSFAQSNGYQTRVGSIDGQPQALTMDYRPERFTLALASGVVTGCTYG